MLAAQARSTSAATGVVQQGQQQVLDGDELVALLARLDKRHVQADFQFLRNHEFHRGVVVIQHDDLVHLRGFGLLCAALQHHRTAVIPACRLVMRCRRFGGVFRSHEFHSIEQAGALHQGLQMTTVS
jgi:hypothetical protein